MRRRRQRTGAAQKRAHGPDARRDAASSAAVLCRSLSATAGGAVLWKKWLDRIIRSPKNTFSQIGGVIWFVLSPWEYDSEQKAGQIGVTEVLSFGTVLLLANAS